MSLLARLPVEPLRLISLHLVRSNYSTATGLAVDKKAYSHTLRLPKTSVPTRHKSPVENEARLRSKLSDELYKWQREHNTGTPFVFLDGPPYANGNLHMGHALNKVLKDFINRHKVLQGRRVRFEPGWDCHGLPIEQKALKEAGKSHTSLDPMRIRDIARRTALEAIEVQKKEMRDLGIMADWDNQDATYRTLDRDYQIRQLKLFQRMVDQGQITYRLRPTYYSPTAGTALAESELKYVDDHESKSVYVGFQVAPADMADKLRHAWTSLNRATTDMLELVVWTTTPWTLPSNLGVAVGNMLEYAIVKTKEGKLLLLQADRLEPMQAVLGSFEILARMEGRDIVGSRYTHLFHPPQASKPRPKVMHSDHVSVESGTGLVHMAPVHGHDDYEAFAAAGELPKGLHCPVDGHGRYDQSLAEVTEMDPQTLRRLIGKEVLKAGNDEVISLLEESGTLIALQPIRHRYPYDWKTKSPIIIRATPQWFADVAAIKERAVESLDKVDFVPASSRVRLESFIVSRSEWCISRQRSWGVPIPVLFDSTGNPLPQHLPHIVEVLERNGADHWWTGTVEEFVPHGVATEGLYKGMDTLDVWFDSGSAWTSVDGEHGQSEGEPLVDVCLEGSDQHRGWFQSSLLTRLITTKESTPVSRSIITHGFIMDEQGRKMSKSEGNGISPMDIVHGGNGQKPQGADALRLWVASVDYTKDVSIGPSSIAQAAEMLRKLRSVMRFALGNISDYREVDDPQYSLLDLYVLDELTLLENRVSTAYDQFAFSRALQSINTFASSTLSSLYYDAIKDTLYCDELNAPRRQAVVAVLHRVLDALMKVVAPLAPHLAEEINEGMPRPYAPSIFAARPAPGEEKLNEQDRSKMNIILDVRRNVHTLLETARAEKLLRTPAEIDLYVNFTDKRMQGLFHENVNLLRALMTTSHVILDAMPQNDDDTWLRQSDYITHNLTITPSRARQCHRCWLHRVENESVVCPRCARCI